jgi:hypothetical protein
LTRQIVLDPVPLVITQGVSAHRSAPIRLTAYESKNAPRRNRVIGSMGTNVAHCCR